MRKSVGKMRKLHFSDAFFCLSFFDTIWCLWYTKNQIVRPILTREIQVVREFGRYFEVTMDKYEYNLKLDQMKSLYAEEKYEDAADIADTIN